MSQIDGKQIKAGSIANSKLGNMANATVKGRNTSGTGAPEDVTMAQLQTLLGITIKITSSDQAITSTSLVDVTNGDFSVAANTDYEFEFSGRIGCSASNGFRWAIVAPAGATVEGQYFAALTTTFNAGVLSANVESVTILTAPSTGFSFSIKATIRNGSTAGTCKLQFRSINAGNTVTHYAGMKLRAALKN